MEIGAVDEVEFVIQSGVSIGPRLFRHGNNIGDIPRDMFLVGFQLGHVFSDMEIKIRKTVVASEHQVFQLGHVFSDMEIP